MAPDGKIALITGANKGIGFEIARRLGALGAVVLAGARDKARGEATVEQLRGEGADAHFLHLDVTDPGLIERAAHRIDERHGRLDILVNNAGINIEWPFNVPSKVSVEQLRTTFETNVHGVAAVTNAVLPLLRRSAAGRIVNVSSEMGLPAWLDGSEMPAITAYSVSKAALNMLTLLYANELRDTSIKVNACSPGFVATDINDGVGERTAEEGAAIEVRLATLDADGPTGRFVTDEGIRSW
ncbi:SDR family oxidoreductase [Streptomyces sp. NBC_00654]|uniref:SDR family oxidoreductase n=1 Tax=Streptomyces sp. NBC_00654 TaxID=2975799 RepID=UPI00225AAE9F|nr:SDR family oxidoreductase [Streptomyces sp. NBC_00654]MCX4970505.1 SDR family oxidoreductase [Streptomyces sp. NBC_00654]